MNAHIINCDEDEFFNNFLPNGWLGVGLYLSSTSPQGLSSACRTSYSMYADMKSIRNGDIIFVHAGEKIYGAFKAESSFLEDPNIDPLYLSRNIHYYPNPNDPNSGWRGNVNAVPDLGYYRKIAISSYFDNNINLCFVDGLDSREIFELKRKKKILSVPERWKYTEAARTVRPLLAYEAVELIKVIHRENADNAERLDVHPEALNNHIPIELILNPNVIENEKIVEGWILENFGNNQPLDDAIGPFTSLGNNMPGGYLKFMDIFGFQELYGGAKKYKIIEVKLNQCSFPDNVNQLIGYMDWVVENVTLGDHKSVEGILFTKGYDQDAIDFVNNFNTLGRSIKLVSFDYNAPLYNELIIQRIV